MFIQSEPEGVFNMSKRLTFLRNALVVAMFSATTCVQAADVNIVALVDESGSMSGEHTFLGTFIPQVESDLLSLGGLTSSYSLIGYGASNPAPHEFTVGMGQFGTAAEFVTASGSLVTNGGTEDGYAAIKFALDNLTFDAGASVAFVLVTDEDRDNTDATLDYASILALLQGQNIALTGILNQSMTDANSNTALGTDGTDSFVADGNGGFVQTAGINYGSAFGTTNADYTQLSLATGGCVADLNQLRAGGTTAQSFSGAFLNCLTAAIQEQVDTGGGAAITNAIKSSPLVRVFFVNRQLGIGVGYNYQNRISVRRLAALQGKAAPSVAFSFNDNGVRLSQADYAARHGHAAATGGGASADGMTSQFERSRLGVFVGGNVSFGDVDATATNPLGAEFKYHSISGGVDYLFRNDLLAGVGVGVVRSDTDVDANGGTAKVDGYSFSVYGSYFPRPDVFLDGSLSYMLMDNDLLRNPGAITGSTDSRQFTGTVTLGMERELQADLTVQPFATVTYNNYKMDGYTESGGVVIGDISSDGLSGELGARLTKRITHASGRQVALHGQASLIHEFKDNDQVIPILSSNTVVRTDGMDRTYMRLGAGISAQVQGNTTLSLSYNTIVAHDELASHTIDAQLRLAFD